MTQPDASRQPDRLDPKLVESLFARLVVRWGRAFMAQYEGVDLEAVKADWARVLARFQREAILYALDNLPAKPMNVEEFRILCRGYRAPEVKRLEAPVGQPPAAVRDAMGKLAEPIKDTRPERVRVAQRYIGKWGTPGVLLSPYQRANLEHMRRILARWDAQQKADVAPSPIEPSEA